MFQQNKWINQWQEYKNKFYNDSCVPDLDQAILTWTGQQRAVERGTLEGNNGVSLKDNLMCLNFW